MAVKNDLRVDASLSANFETPIAIHECAELKIFLKGINPGIIFDQTTIEVTTVNRFWQKAICRTIFNSIFTSCRPPKCPG